jgi:hypothetical protein
MIPVTDSRRKRELRHTIMSITRLEKLLKSGADGRLDKIIQRAQNIDVLTRELQAELPAELAENLLSANVHDNGELVLVCSTSAWAARLRFEGNALIAAANKAGHSARACRVTVGHTQSS